MFICFYQKASALSLCYLPITLDEAVILSKANYSPCALFWPFPASSKSLSLQFSTLISYFFKICSIVLFPLSTRWYNYFHLKMSLFTHLLFQIMPHFSAPSCSKCLEWVALTYFLSPFLLFSCVSAPIRLLSPILHLKALIKNITNLSETKTLCLKDFSRVLRCVFFFSNKGRIRKFYSSFGLRERTPILYKILENRYDIIITMAENYQNNEKRGCRV